MHPDLAKAALVFLHRTDLKGAEATAFLQVVQALEAIANPPPLPPVEDAG